MDADTARRSARRRAMIRLGHDGSQHERESFACAVACLDCGRLEQQERAGDPMRTDVLAPTMPSDPCRGCGGRAWADLAVIANAELLREHERREIELRQGVLPALGVATFSAGVGVLAMVAGALGRIDVLMTFSTVAIAFAFAAFLIRRVRAGLTTRRRSATRWHAPARCYRVGRHMASGRASASRRLIAPLSGREVLGWRIEVRYPGDRGDAFALVEQSIADLALDGRMLPGEPTLATRAVPVTDDGANAHRYLRSRGIDPHDLLEIHERVILDGAALALHTDARGGPPILIDRSVTP